MRFFFGDSASRGLLLATLTPPTVNGEFEYYYDANGLDFDAQTNLTLTVNGNQAVHRTEQIHPTAGNPT